MDEIWIRAPNGKQHVHRVYADPTNPSLAEPGALFYYHQQPNGMWVGAPAADASVQFLPINNHRIAANPFESDDPVLASNGRPAQFTRVSLTSVDGELQVCGVGSSQVFLRSRQPDRPGLADGSSFRGRWTDVEVAAGERGAFVDVACAGVFNPTTNREELHLVAVTDDGHLWHTIGDRAPSGEFVSWSPFGDVEGQTGDLGEFVKVDASGNGWQLHVIGVTRAGRPWHTIRIPGRWRAAEDVGPSGPATDVATGYCNEGVPPYPTNPSSDVSQLNVVLISGGKVLHTVRSANPISWAATQPSTHWKPMMNLSLLAGSDRFTPAAPSVSERPFPTSWRQGD